MTIRMRFFDIILSQCYVENWNHEVQEAEHREAYLKSGDDSMLKKFPKNTEFGEKYVALNEATVVDASNLSAPFSQLWEKRFEAWGEVEPPDQEDQSEGASHLPIDMSSIPIRKGLDGSFFIEWESDFRQFGVEIWSCPINEERTIWIDHGDEKHFVNYQCEASVFCSDEGRIECESRDFTIFDHTRWDDGKESWDLWHVCVDFALYVFKLIGSKKAILSEVYPDSRSSAICKNAFGIPLTKYHKVNQPIKEWTQR